MASRVGLDGLLAFAGLFQPLGLIEELLGLGRDPGCFFIAVLLGRQRSGQDGQQQQGGDGGLACRNFEHHDFFRENGFSLSILKIGAEGEGRGPLGGPGGPISQKIT